MIISWVVQVYINKVSTVVDYKPVVKLFRIWPLLLMVANNLGEMTVTSLYNTYKVYYAILIRLNQGLRGFYNERWRPMDYTLPPVKCPPRPRVCTVRNSKILQLNRRCGVLATFVINSLRPGP